MYYIFPAIFLIWAVIHSLMASLTFKDFAKRIFGRFYLFYRLLYVIVATVSLAAIWFFVPRPAGRIYYIGGVLFYILKGVQTLALIAFVFAGSQFDMEEFLGFASARRFFSGKPEPDKPEPLNKDGFFAYLRHPLYLFGMIILWSDPDMTVWWFELSIIITVYLIVGSYFEEKKLVAIYGDEYRQYQEHVPMWVPRLGRLWLKKRKR